MNQTNVKSVIATCRHTSIKALFLMAIISVFSITNAQTSPESDALGPPTLGEQTKGKPAIAEVKQTETEALTTSGEQSQSDSDQPKSAFDSTFGSTKITEHKRENGQVYLIELENSLGSKQYLYENDSDGKIGSTAEDRESITEIPKWKLGSW